MSVIVSVSLPPRVKSTLDAESRRQRRSRSFVVAEAIREYTDRRTAGAFADARDETLRDGLARSPAARVRESEDLWQELTRGSRPAKPWTATFRTFAEHDAWLRADRGHRA